MMADSPAHRLPGVSVPVSGKIISFLRGKPNNGFPAECTSCFSATFKPWTKTKMIETTHKRFLGPVIRLHPADNIVVARTDVGIGIHVPEEGFTSRSQVPAGHK